MSNGYPYFKFHVDRWLTGKISAFDFEEQGFFLHLCMLAWVARGAFNVCSTSVQRRFKKTAAWVSESVAAFAEVGIIARDGDRWRIKFIDEQLCDLGELRDKRSKAGRASAAARAVETPPAPPSVTTERVEKRREEKRSVFNTRSTGVEHVLNNAAKAAPARPRNPLMDALASTDGNLNEILEAGWRKVGAALASIREATPDVTPEEITRRAANYESHFEGAALTSTALAKHWAKCGAERPPIKARPVEHRNWNDLGTGGL